MSLSAALTALAAEPPAEQVEERLSNYEKHLTAIADAAGVRLNGSEFQWSEMTQAVVAKLAALTAASSAANPPLGEQ
jgi:hypothetical protein